jgi:hypothetical protein
MDQLVPLYPWLQVLLEYLAPQNCGAESSPTWEPAYTQVA